MSSWTLTIGLQNLRAQINEWAPNRDTTSDGTIGDAAHAAESASGHNPDDTKGSHPEWNGDPDSKPEVRAIDVDTDFNNGVSAQTFVDHIVSLKPSSVLRYVIYNRKIYEASNGWKSRAYTGESAHTEHIHFSGAYSQASDDNKTFNFRLEDIPVSLTSADKTWFQNAINMAVASLTATTPLKGADDKLDGTSNSKIGAAALGNGIPDPTRAKVAGEYPRSPAYTVIENVGEKVVAVAADVAAIKAVVVPK